MTSDQVLSVARALTGSTAVVAGDVTTTPLTGGRANRGCFLHEVRLGDRLMRYVEKRTALEREVAFYRDISPLLSDSGSTVAPAVYSITPGDGHTCLFLECIANTGHRVTWSQPVEAALVAAIAVVASIDPTRVGRTSVGITDNLRQKVTTRLAELEAGANGRLEAVESVRAAVDGAGALQAAVDVRLPVVAAHNDVAGPNMAVSLGDAVSVRFIDWGKFGRNVVGADLHHFARQAALDEAMDPMFQRLVDALAAQLRRQGLLVDEQDVAFGATHYALQRAMTRVLTGGTPQQLAAVGLLHQRVDDQRRRGITHARK